MTAKTSLLEIYHMGNACEKMVVWAAWSHRDGQAPTTPSVCHQDPAMQELRAWPSNSATRSPLRLFTSHGRKHSHNPYTHGWSAQEQKSLTLTPSHHKLSFLIGLPIGDRGHCSHPLPVPPRAQVLTSPTANPIHGCSHFSPSLSPFQADPNHIGGSPAPPGPATLLTQNSPVSLHMAPRGSFSKSTNHPIWNEAKTPVALPLLSHTKLASAPGPLHVLFLTPGPTKGVTSSRTPP